MATAILRTLSDQQTISLLLIGPDPATAIADLNAATSSRDAAIDIQATYDDPTLTLAATIRYLFPVSAVDLRAFKTRISDYLTSIGYTIEPAYTPIALTLVGVGELVGQLVGATNMRATFAGVGALTGALAAVSITESDTMHATLRQFAHFVDDGPGEGFASGAYKETLPAGAPFHTSEVWWASSAKLLKLIELNITRDASKKPIVETWTLFGGVGNVLVELVDSIVYSGPFELSRTRVWS